MARGGHVEHAVTLLVSGEEQLDFTTEVRVITAALGDPGRATIRRDLDCFIEDRLDRRALIAIRRRR
jgi:hypothetical protein